MKGVGSGDGNGSKESQQEEDAGAMDGDVELVNKITGKTVSLTRADLLDLTDLDAALERSLARKQGSKKEDEAGGKRKEKEKERKEQNDELAAWEIDVTKLVLKQKIAKGTFGVVYRGLYNGKDAAVKVLDFGEDETCARANQNEHRASFRKEAAVWSTLDHPNVTKFIGASVTDESGFFIPSFIPDKRGNMRIGGHLCCLVVEFVPGGTLKDFLIKYRHKKLPLRTVLQLALDLAHGLAYLHSKKVVHRDVKTENLLLDRRRRVKIADFGVARVQAANPKDMTGSTGTLGYMAPEVLDGKNYDYKADVYSFSICLWEIYCCDMPFPDLNLREMAAVVNKGLRPVIPGVCPPALAAVMRKCWDGKPEKRPAMEEVVEMIEKINPRSGEGMAPVEDIPQGCFFCWT